MLARFIAVFRSLWLSLRHAGQLGIRPAEYLRYLRKSVNLAICYTGFCDSARLEQAPRAGQAAFLCCAYDVVTDWRSFNVESFKVFSDILAQTTSPDLADLALSLYRKEKSEGLQDDGLERGAISLEFVTRLMGCGGRFRESDYLDSTGRLLQLVDDLLDYEEDLRTGDLNCLSSPRRAEYLARAEELASSAFLASLSRDSVLIYVIQLAVAKARFLRAQDQRTPADAVVG